jgi:hypothetical protein
MDSLTKTRMTSIRKKKRKETGNLRGNKSNTTSLDYWREMTTQEK